MPDRFSHQRRCRTCRPEGPCMRKSSRSGCLGEAVTGQTFTGFSGCDKLVACLFRAGWFDSLVKCGFQACPSAFTAQKRLPEPSSSLSGRHSPSTRNGLSIWSFRYRRLQIGLSGCHVSHLDRMFAFVFFAPSLDSDSTSWLALILKLG